MASKIDRPMKDTTFRHTKHPRRQMGGKFTMSEKPMAQHVTPTADCKAKHGKAKA